nr:hypothetical transcript [Hymenolepis microstoma]
MSEIKSTKGRLIQLTLNSGGIASRSEIVKYLEGRFSTNREGENLKIVIFLNLTLKNSRTSALHPVNETFHNVLTTGSQTIHSFMGILINCQYPSSDGLIFCGSSQAVRFN